MRKERMRKILLHEKEIIETLLEELSSEENLNEEMLRYYDYWHYKHYRFYRDAENEIRKLRRTIEKKLERVDVNCPLAKGSSDSNVLEMLTGLSMRNEGLKEIRDFTKNTENLIVIDPYIYGGETGNSKKYIDEFTKSSRLQSLKKLHIVYSSKHGNTKAIKNGIETISKEVGCTFSDVDNSSIHDRIWISDRQRAITVGTSLGGLGNRLCFILQLPKVDLENLLEYLDENELSRRKVN